MADREILSWVSAQLHDVVGFSDKTVAQYIVAAAKRASDPRRLLTDLADTEQLPANPKSYVNPTVMVTCNRMLFSLRSDKKTFLFLPLISWL